MSLKKGVLFIVFFIAFSCYAQTTILFIGNSITYVNDLPQTFKKLCDENNKLFDITMVAFPGYSLINHLTKIRVPTDNPNLVWTKRVSNNDTVVPESIKQIQSKKWDYIYLQDREYEEDSTEFAVQKIRKLSQDSKIMIFENYMYDSRWSKKYDHRKKKANTREFKRIAKLINADVIPASYFFEKIKKKHSSELLYDETMHPKYFGTIVIAILIYKTIYPHEKFSFNCETFKITDKEWKILKKIIKKN